MNMNDFNSFFKMVNEIHHKENFGISIFLFNLCIIVIFFLIYYDLKPKSLINEKRYLLLFSLVCIVDFIAECIIGNIIIIVPVVSFLIVQLFLLFKDKELFKFFSSTKSEDKNLDKKDEKEIELQSKIKHLGKDNGYNLLDILYLYDYITDYQRRKVIQNLIYDDVDSMVDFLNKHPAVSDAELKEAQAILNLINLNGRIVTKQEAMFYLLDNSVEKEELNKKDRKEEDHDD